jgi:hypothetical protein
MIVVDASAVLVTVSASNFTGHPGVGCRSVAVELLPQRRQAALAAIPVATPSPQRRCANKKSARSTVKKIVHQ